MSRAHMLALLLLGAVWGASFLFIGVAVAALGPFPLMFLRVGLASLVLLAIIALRRERAALDVRGRWRQYLLVGLLNSAIPFSLIAYAELRIPVSLSAILNATTPLFTALIAALWGGEPLTRRRLAGVALGVVGVAVLMGGGAFGVGQIVGILAMLLASCFYGAGTVYAARRIRGLPPVFASLAQLLGASAALAIPAALSLPHTPPSPEALAALAALVLLSTVGGYQIYFFLLREIGPTSTSSVTFIVPLFGCLWGALLRHDTLGANVLVGMLVIFASVALVLRAPPSRAAPAAARP